MRHLTSGTKRIQEGVGYVPQTDCSRVSGVTWNGFARRATWKDYFTEASQPQAKGIVHKAAANPDARPARPTAQAPILDYARTDFTTLEQGLTIGEALERIRQGGIGERIIYFYVTDADGKLVGVLPVRRLLTAPADQPLAQAMVRRVAAIRRRPR